MTAGVERISQRKWQARCLQCTDGVDTSRQVDAHIWASEHNLEKHDTRNAERANA